MPSTHQPSQSEINDALATMCPRCGALPGHQCRTKEYWKVVYPPHKVRCDLGAPRVVKEKS